MVQNTCKPLWIGKSVKAFLFCSSPHNLISLKFLTKKNRCIIVLANRRDIFTLMYHTSKRANIKMKLISLKYSQYVGDPFEWKLEECTFEDINLIDNLIYTITLTYIYLLYTITYQYSSRYNMLIVHVYVHVQYLFNINIIS